ncbi:hypothetical protein B0H10DRAFT_2047489 [Mycena sp. CBHHK59/15]|nr:hypothetical protein B0H10DRAFT_2047489 [Mycena sp. CBHHK59/15]
MPPTLPTEILEQVIDASKDNRRTLAACGAASKRLLPRSRVHLFRKLAFGAPRVDITRRTSSMYPSAHTRCDVFWDDILQANPSLAQHVTELALSEGGHPNLTIWWISQSATLVPVVQRLSNLRKFTLRYGHTSEWSSVLMQTMSICIHRPSLDFVDLSGLNMPDVASLSTVFTGGHPGRKLQNLRISNMGLQSDLLRLEEAPGQNPLEVDSLNVTFHHDWELERPFVDLLSGSLPLIDMSRLRHLRLTVGNDLSLVSQWLRLSADSLTQLDLKFIGDWTWRDPPVANQHFAPISRLRVIRFEIHVPRAMPAVSTILRMLRAANLTDIILLSGKRGLFGASDVFDAEWPTFDSIVSIQYFPSLTVVRFESGGTALVGEWESRLRERLPRLDNAGLLSMVHLFLLSRATAEPLFSELLDNFRVEEDQASYLLA